MITAVTVTMCHHHRDKLYQWHTLLAYKYCESKVKLYDKKIIVHYSHANDSFLRENLDCVHFNCGQLDLGQPTWTKIVEVHRVDPTIMHRHIFDFRSRNENRKL